MLSRHIWSLPRLLLLSSLCLVLAACSSATRWDEPGAGRPAARPAPAADRTTAARPAWHVVQTGETLYAIAFRYGLSVTSLAAWNHLGDGSLIRVGQRLRLTSPQGSGPASPATAASGSAVGPAAGTGVAGGAGAGVMPPRWQWPVTGPLVARFGDAPLTASGVQLGGRIGAAVQAAAGGLVVYAGNGLAGYGELLIIKHNADWLSAYGYNEMLLVREGEQVQAGQTIARMGEGPSAVTRDRRALLHFEIRRNGAPVDPLTQLPARP